MVIEVCFENTVEYILAFITPFAFIARLGDISVIAYLIFTQVSKQFQN
jgi:hypothetical protein